MVTISSSSSLRALNGPLPRSLCLVQRRLRVGSVQFVTRPSMVNVRRVVGNQPKTSLPIDVSSSTTPHYAPKTAFMSEWRLPNFLQLSTVGDPSFVRHPRYMHRSSDRCMIISPNATPLRHCVILTSTTSNPSIASIKKARL